MLWGYVVAESGVSLVVKGVWATLTPPLDRETDCDKITANQTQLHNNQNTIGYYVTRLLPL